MSCLLLIRRCKAIYQPEPIESCCDVLAGTRINAVLGDSSKGDALEEMGLVTVVDGEGLVAVPGFIDLHMHIAGGGGEAGPWSRTPEAKLSEILNAGITTAVGITGTDAVTRSQENLVTKSRALTADGITCLSWCGSYRLPPATATGSIQRDMCLVEGCIGVGEVAVSDHRGSVPRAHELARVVAEARVGGMLSGKAGIVHCHMGPGAARLAPLREALACSNGDLPITQILPTHMDRSPELIAEGEQWLKDGGWLDFTCREASCRQALQRYYDKGLPLSHCTVSTDAYGSLPVFDDRGQLVAYDVADPGAMLRFLRAMHLTEPRWPLERILPLMTSNPATILKLPSKGRLTPGCDADLLLLEPNTLELRYVVSKGEVVKAPEWVRGGMFEKGPGIRPRRPV